MLKRFLARLSYANVMVTILAFLVLGGGYAMAVAGSGSLQKGGLGPIPSALTTVRTMTGVGSIKASCSSGEITVVFKNTSGEALAIRQDEDGDQIVESGDTSTDLLDGFSDGLLNDGIAPIDGSKAPQVNLQISVHDAGPCNTSSVNVLATNTQE